MNRRDGVARFRVDSAEWDEFVAHCRARDITPSQALRAYVRGIIRAEREAAPGQAAGPGGRLTDRDPYTLDWVQGDNSV